MKEKERRQTQVMSKVRTVGKPSLGGPFNLFHHDGTPISDETYKKRGEWMLLYFGFTFCPDICPSELVKMGAAIDRIDANPKVDAVIKPVFISVDPKRDSIAQLKNYKQDYHPKFDFLTGTPKQVAAAARWYRVYFSDTNNLDDEDTDYLVDHSIVMYLVDPDGNFIDFYTQLADVNEIVSRIETSVNEYKENKIAKITNV
eukprot:GSMAST32.ASY1.ANO1.2166.1 assembled CDS